MRKTVPIRKTVITDSHIERVSRSLHGLAFRTAQERHNALLKRKIFIGSAVFTLLACLLLFLSPKTTAETAMFYPDNCLGGWGNPSLASGEPETDKDGVGYSDQNSAVLGSNISADIFCGNFKGTIPENTVPNAVVIRLFMSYNGTSGTTTIKGDNFISNAGAVLDADASTSPVFQLDTSTTFTSTPASTDTSTTSSSSTTNTPDQPVTDSSAATSSQDTASSTGATPATDTPPQFSRLLNNPLASLLSNVFDRAYADEATNTATDSITSLATTSITDVATSTDTASSTDTATDTATSSPADTQLFEILYTLDGKTWNSLGVLNKDQLEGAQFSVPLASTTTWVDLSALQVQVKRLTTFDDIPSIYLDGMSLEVTYAKQQELQEDLSADPKRYDIAVSTSTDSIKTDVGQGEDGVHLTIGTAAGGQLFIYSKEDGQIKYSIGVGSDPAQVSSYQFDPGDYTAVMTNRENGCIGLSLSECEGDPKTIGHSDFSIMPTRDTPNKYLPSVGQ